MALIIMTTLKYMKSVDREFQNNEHITMIVGVDTKHQYWLWRRYELVSVTLYRVGKLSMMMSSYLVTPVSRKTSC